MKDKLKKVTSAPKKVAIHVYARRGRYGTAAGIITGAVLMQKLHADTLDQALAFLEQKGLTEEFYLNDIPLTQ
jgi:hypothetical protein